MFKELLTRVNERDSVMYFSPEFEIREVLVDLYEKEQLQGALSLSEY